MAKYQFPIGKKTLEVYHREAKNTKAKIRRIAKNYGIDLSNEIKVPDISSFSTRKEFNKWVQDVQSFRNRANQNYQFVKNEFGIVASKVEVNRINRKNKRMQEKAKREQEKYKESPFYSGGTEQGTVGMQRADKIGISIPNDFDFSDVRSRSRLQEIEENLDKRLEPEHYNKKAEQMKENYIDMLKQDFNSGADELINMIEKIPPEHFFQLYLSYDEFDFSEYYKIDMTVDIETDEIKNMIDIIKSYQDGDIDTDMWHSNFNRK